MKWLYDAITMGNPLNYKLPFCLWSLNNIRAMLQKEREVLLSKSSICRLLGHLGLTPQKPLYKSYKQDPDKINDYLNKTYPEAVAQAKKYHARINFWMRLPFAVTHTVERLGASAEKHQWLKIAAGVLALN